MTARASSSPTAGLPSSPPAAAGRARASSPLGIPLTAHQAMRLEELERRGCLGWGQEPSGVFFVDMKPLEGDEPERFHGETLHLALGRALRARGGGRP